MKYKTFYLRLKINNRSVENIELKNPAWLAWRRADPKCDILVRSGVPGITRRSWGYWVSTSRYRQWWSGGSAIGGNVYIGKALGQTHCILEMNQTGWGRRGGREGRKAGTSCLTCPPGSCWGVLTSSSGRGYQCYNEPERAPYSNKIIIPYFSHSLLGMWRLLKTEHSLMEILLPKDFSVVLWFVDVFSTIHWFRKPSYFPVPLMGTLNPHWHIKCQ